MDIVKILSDEIQAAVARITKASYAAGYSQGRFEAGKSHTVESLNRGKQLSEQYYLDNKEA